MTEEQWFALYDETWPKIKLWVVDKPVHDIIMTSFGHGKKHFQYDVFVDYDGKGFHETMEILRSEKQHRKLWRVLESIWLEAPDHPIVHSFPGWNDFVKLTEGYPFDA